MKVGVTALGSDSVVSCGFRLVHDSTGPDWVSRGGSCYALAQHARVALRLQLAPTDRFAGLGFRLVRATEQG